MCDNTIILFIFILLKVIATIILPIIIFIKRKNKISKILIIINIIMLLFFVIGSFFNINSCVYNSNIDGIKRVQNKNKIILYNSIHPKQQEGYSSEGIIPDKNYRTINNTSLYYYNQNKPYMSNAYYECEGKKVYMNSFGSGFTAFSIAISTLYDKNINPVQLFEIYKSNYQNLCIEKIELTDIYNSTMNIYGGITMTEISSNEVYQGLKNGGYIIVELSSNENSKLTCENGYIVIYNISKDGNYMIADPSLLNNSYVCPYSSSAYGNIISSNKMEKSYSLEDIDNEAIRYYLVKKG